MTNSQHYPICVRRTSLEGGVWVASQAPRVAVRSRAWAVARHEGGPAAHPPPVPDPILECGAK